MNTSYAQACLRCCVYDGDSQTVDLIKASAHAENVRTYVDSCVVSRLYATSTC